MKEIELFASTDGKVVFKGIAKDLTLEEVCADAEHLWNIGKAEYVRVSVDGEIYMELES